MNERMFQDKLTSCKSLLDIQVISMTNILEKRLVLSEIDQMIKSNPDLQQKMAKASRDRAVNHFDNDIIIPHYERYYESVRDSVLNAV